MFSRFYISFLRKRKTDGNRASAITKVSRNIDKTKETNYNIYNKKGPV